MAHIKVTGWIDTDELSPEFVDLTHATGLSNEGYEALHGISSKRFDYGLADLDDLEVELLTKD